MGVLELDGEILPVLGWIVFGVRPSTVHLIDEVLKRRGPGSLVAQVVDDTTTVLIGDELETRVKTVGRHDGLCSTEVHQLQRFSHLREF